MSELSSQFGFMWASGLRLSNLACFRRYSGPMFHVEGPGVAKFCPSTAATSQRLRGTRIQPPLLPQIRRKRPALPWTSAMCKPSKALREMLLEAWQWVWLCFAGLAFSVWPMAGVDLDGPWADQTHSGCPGMVKENTIGCCHRRCPPAGVLTAQGLAWVGVCHPRYRPSLCHSLSPSLPPPPPCCYPTPSVRPYRPCCVQLWRCSWPKVFGATRARCLSSAPAPPTHLHFPICFFPSLSSLCLDLVDMHIAFYLSRLACSGHHFSFSLYTLYI